jgi:hydroxymethylglutaryl-CoA synthase
MATAMVARKPNKKILILAADISRYGLNTVGESSQGCGAVAMLITANPRIMAIEPEAGLHTEDVMDFWRPNYRSEALVEGHYSTKVYLNALEQTWQAYAEESGRSFDDHAYICYHNPIPRLVEKAQQTLRAFTGQEKLSREENHEQLKPVVLYGKESGNSYAAALYVSLASLLDNAAEDLTGKRIGFYSYGSGCVAEFFSGVVQPGYKAVLNTAEHETMLANRQALTYPEYESFYSFQLPQNGGECKTAKHETGAFRLAGIKEHKRLYEVVQQGETKVAEDLKVEGQIKALSPGKLILSGEHAANYQQPVLAMAIDKYSATTVKDHEAEKLAFNLLNFNYRDSFTINTLREMKKRVKGKYKDFLAGKAGVRDILQQPFELTQYAVVNWLDHMNEKFANGLDLHTESSIPVGCGMGSSAASILSVLKAVTRFQGKQWDKEQYYKVAKEIEQMQHGKSSGIDVYISLHGGCVYFHEGQAQARALPQVPMFLVNTGAPQVTTGESVTQVAKQFADSDIWNTFGTVTNIMDKAVQANDLGEVKSAVKDNHQLLNKIGVVPAKVRQFIQLVEAQGDAAKISGAGATSGDAAGAVLVVAEREAPVKRLCDQFGYELTAVKADAKGLRVAETA